MHRACYTVRKRYWREDCSAAIGVAIVHERPAGGGFHESSSQWLSHAWVAPSMEQPRDASSCGKGPTHQRATKGFSRRTHAALVSPLVGVPGVCAGILRVVERSGLGGLEHLSNCSSEAGVVRSTQAAAVTRYYSTA